MSYRVYAYVCNNDTYENDPYFGRRSCEARQRSHRYRGENRSRSSWTRSSHFKRSGAAAHQIGRHCARFGVCAQAPREAVTMILVDTSIWIDHLRSGNDMLASLLGNGLVLVHPFIVGELACGSLPSRNAFIKDLQRLPVAPCSTNEEALHVLQRHELFGIGIGWVDIHLIASALLSGSQLFTLDERLARAAVKAKAGLHSRVQ